MKKLLCFLLTAALLAGCAAPAAGTTPAEPKIIHIDLTNDGISFESAAGDAVGWNDDIIYYEAGHGADYGEGESFEAHTAEEAAEYTVVLITEPGTYEVTGYDYNGQIAVDLGEGAKDDPNAVVTLILKAKITCHVAPAIIFYNVYESNDPGGTAGANIVVPEGFESRIIGSHVAKIYQPGTEETLHKYDGAIYSRMSMTVGGEGSLFLFADNEGLCSEKHLTINGGSISIQSANDGINANADGESVVTVNGGHLICASNGSSGEGDGIDSNGSIVINGGIVESYACPDSGDFGLDADLGVQLSGGTVIATGNMPDRIGGSQTHALFSFAEKQPGGVYTLMDQTGETVLEGNTPNAFQSLLLSSPDLAEGTCTLWSGGTQFECFAGPGGFFGDLGPIERPDFPGKGDGDVEIPPQPTMPIVPQGEQPENMPVPPMPGDATDMPTPPIPEDSDNMPVPQPPAGVQPPQGGRQPVQIITGTLSGDFPIQTGGNYFMNVRPMA